MSGVINVEPRPDSYVLEWRAVEVNDENLNVIRRILKGLGASVFADFASDKSDDGVLLHIVFPGLTLRARPGDYLIVSPHDKVLVVDSDTFVEQFRA
jgi:hypothetical protein